MVSKENAHLETKRKKLEEGNERSYSELQEATGGRFGMDTSDLRRELMYEHLVRWGIITETQALEFEVAFHEKVEMVLNKQWELLRKAKGAQALTVVKKPSSLVDQHGRKLT